MVPPSEDFITVQYLHGLWTFGGQTVINYSRVQGEKKRDISLSEGDSFLPVLSEGLSGQGERQDNTLKGDAIESMAQN